MTLSERKKREKEQRKKDIQEAARELLIEKGYENVTMNHIAQKSELARSTLYLYFKNKEEIYLDIALENFQVLNDKFQKCYKKKVSGMEKIRLLTRAYIKFYQEYPSYSLSRFYYEIPFDPDFTCMEDLKKIRLEIFSMVVKSFQEGLEDGSIRPGVDPVKSALILTSSMQNIINLTPAIQMHMQDHGLSHQEVIEYNMDLMMNCLENKTTRN
ncbi:TetR/AcrR family transcriptional regulator [Methanobacterium alkalithermotolerans]|uniref:TetR/AcrR family transcriptional regulator n=1 Tax=Methanobacterium alkalithermotolerans TaxID=2731220 RepID=A0A8T8K4K1_9EURY|nr:TetR/AcrR family transcriptional regulator [Methanobacterium alkalithermotolerans]QUH22395.1 TetR/AcrR family transcriptional regulator [Methanobacterium alkalithermotolerans]